MKINFSYEGIQFVLEATEFGVVRVTNKGYGKTCEVVRKLDQICEVQIRGRMTHGHTGTRHLQSSESGMFRYVSHYQTEDDKGATLEVVQESDIARLHSYFFVPRRTNTLRVWNRIENKSKASFTLEYVGTYGELMITEPNTFQETEFWLPSNGSYCECQWCRAPLTSFGVFGGHNMKSFKKFCVSNTGTWSTKSYLPMGALKNKDGTFVLWQIEANGSWSYEMSDLFDSLTLHLNGPSFEEHNWQKTLLPGEAFETVKAAITHGNSFNEVIANMTEYRRKITDRDRIDLPVIFNEYMYASWNSPSERTAEMLIPVAKEFGAGYYVIDCGWHDEPEDPFYYIGKWHESCSRYPHGLKKTIDRVKKEGMIPGLWIEPEVVGAKGDAFSLYGKDAYFSRGGKLLGISDRYQLDFRCKEVLERMDRIIDRLVGEYGIGYLKIDYNIEAGVGTDNRAESCGDGLLEHNRAYICWIEHIRKKYPELVIENCASGGNRMDYLTLGLCDVQSTSDQIDYKVYPYIAANMFSALIPEQAAVWAYPASHAEEAQPDRECVIMNMINGLSGRMHLASKLYLLKGENVALVKEAAALTCSLDGFRKRAIPWFHRDQPTEMDMGQVVFGLRDEKRIVAFVYRMSGAESINICVGIPVASVRVLYPSASEVPLQLEGDCITLKMPYTYMARVIEIIIK